MNPIDQILQALQNLYNLVFHSLPLKQTTISGTVNPITDGVSAALGTIYNRTIPNGTTILGTYHKVGPANTDWVEFGSGGGGGSSDIKTWTIFNDVQVDGKYSSDKTETIIFDEWLSLEDREITVVATDKQKTLEIVTANSSANLKPIYINFSNPLIGSSNNQFIVDTVGYTYLFTFFENTSSWHLVSISATLANDYTIPNPPTVNIINATSVEGDTEIVMFFSGKIYGDVALPAASYFTVTENVVTGYVERVNDTTLKINVLNPITYSPTTKLESIGLLNINAFSDIDYVNQPLPKWEHSSVIIEGQQEFILAANLSEDITPEHVPYLTNIILESTTPDLVISLQQCLVLGGPVVAYFFEVVGEITDLATQNINITLPEIPNVVDSTYIPNAIEPTFSGNAIYDESRGAFIFQSIYDDSDLVNVLTPKLNEIILKTQTGDLIPASHITVDDFQVFIEFSGYTPNYSIYSEVYESYVDLGYIEVPAINIDGQELVKTTTFFVCISPTP